MINFFEWAQKEKAQMTDWLLLGKGPSFSKLAQYNTSGYHSITLNHAIRETKAKLAHMIDLDVFIDCQDAIYDNTEYIVMPYYPNIENKIVYKSLEEHAESLPILKKMIQEKRVLWYVPSYSKKTVGDSPKVSVFYFSAEAAVNLLAMAGVKTIRTLGIDGGDQYSNSFEDLKDVTRLNNGHSTYNLQNANFCKSIYKYDLEMYPLDFEKPVFYIGSQPEQDICVKVLEYSIIRNSGMSVNVIPLHSNDIPIPQPQKPDCRPRTPFSFQRLLIPQLMDYTGTAYYLDSDMLILADIRELCNWPFADNDLLYAQKAPDAKRSEQFSVLKINCSAAQWDITDIVQLLDSGSLNYFELMQEFKICTKKEGALPYGWNSLEAVDKNTRLLHYTDMNSQPWLTLNHPLEHIWLDYLKEAIREDIIPLSLLESEIEQQHVRPSLLRQVTEQDVPAESLLETDLKFTPPHLRKK